MIICEAVEPKKLLEAFGAVTTFSVVFVLGSQLALFNIIEDFGIPFYRQASSSLAQLGEG